MWLFKSRGKRKAIQVFKRDLRRKLSDDWGNKRKYSATEISSSVQNHYPALSKHAVYAIYMWSEKKQFDLYCSESDISLSPIEARKEIESAVSSMNGSDPSVSESSYDSSFSDSGGSD
ncbi:hypothetical protein ACJJID_11615 [Microbulbifer sp. CnH-101-G]|uniref:hypothetical protein n=1 Tax=Microbulbifer sp. CnH-101-G TaxID=3243393 RepID=UPI004039B5AA